MIEFEGGPLPFKADAIASDVDSRGCLIWVYLDGDVLKLRFRGSEDPYPISDEIIIGSGFKGSGSIFPFNDGLCQIEWPKDNEAWHLYFDPLKFKDPSKKKIPPKPKYPPQIEDLHCGLGSFLWFQRIAGPVTGRKDAIEQLESFLFELRMRGVAYNKFFCWLQTRKGEHSHLVGKMPYSSIDFVSDLDSWDPLHFELYRIFIDCHVKYGIKPIVNPLMNERYCDLPYSNNRQGVHGLLDDRAMPFQRRLMDKYCQETEAITGTGNYMMKPMNEMQHGNAHDFHVNGDWHRDMIEGAILNWLPIHKIIGDVSESEGVGLHMTEPGMECGKPLVPGETHGSPDYDRSDIKKCILRELHGVSTLKSLTETERMMWVDSRNQSYIMDEDGPGHGDEEGMRFGNFRFPSARQTEEMLRYALPRAIRKGKGFKFSIFPPGFSSEWIEDYSVELLQKVNFWERLDVTQKVYYELLGM